VQNDGTWRPPLYLPRAPRSRPRKKTPLAGHHDHVGTASLCFTCHGARHALAADNPESRGLFADGSPSSGELLCCELLHYSVPVARPCVATVSIGCFRNRHRHHGEGGACVRGDLHRVTQRSVAARVRLVERKYVGGQSHGIKSLTHSGNPLSGTEPKGVRPPSFVLRTLAA
jgi:hypothetical protein